jgi:O-acetyl-ADP-ribose deacetylase (regulator of RNase III)
VTLDAVTLDGPGAPAGPLRVEVDVRHQDILRAEADAIGCLLTPRLEPDDEASRQLFAVAGPALRDDIRWALTRRGRPGLEPGEALTLAVRKEYPVGRVGFLILADSARERGPEEREALVLAAFLREALEWGFESVALPVSDRGVGESLAVAARLLARTSGEGRPLLKRLQFLSRDAAALAPERRGVA